MPRTGRPRTKSGEQAKRDIAIVTFDTFLANQRKRILSIGVYQPWRYSEHELNLLHRTEKLGESLNWKWDDIQETVR